MHAYTGSMFDYQIPAVLSGHGYIDFSSDLKCVYDYTDREKDVEKDTIVEWFFGSASHPAHTSTPAAEGSVTSIEASVPNNEGSKMNGKEMGTDFHEGDYFVWCEVTVVSADGVTAAAAVSSPMYSIRYLTTKVNDANIVSPDGVRVDQGNELDCDYGRSLDQTACVCVYL